MSSGYISLTMKCPNRCLNCPLHEKDFSSHPDLSIDEVRATVEAGIEHGMTRITLSGGEPMLHRHFLKVMEVLAQYPIVVGFLTTAITLSNRRFLNDLLSVMPASRMNIATAIHSFDSKLHDYMMQHEGSLKYTLTGLHHAIDAGIQTTVKHLITAPTYRHMPEFVERLYTEFPDRVTLLLCNIDYCGVAYKQQEAIKVSYAESRPYLSQALDFVRSRAAESKRLVRVLDTPRCAIDEKYWPYLHSQAGMKIPVYNDPNNENREFRENLQNISGPYFKPCYRCKMQSQCPGTWPSVKGVFGEDIFIPFE